MPPTEYYLADDTTGRPCIHSNKAGPGGEKAMPVSGSSKSGKRSPSSMCFSQCPTHFSSQSGSSKISNNVHTNILRTYDIIFVCPVGSGLAWYQLIMPWLCHLPEITSCLASCEETHGRSTTVSVAVLGYRALEACCCISSVLINVSQIG